jgi:hypothetical protein
VCGVWRAPWFMIMSYSLDLKVGRHAICSSQTEGQGLPPTDIQRFWVGKIVWLDDRFDIAVGVHASKSWAMPVLELALDSPDRTLIRGIRQPRYDAD